MMEEIRTVVLEERSMSNVEPPQPTQQYPPQQAQFQYRQVPQSTVQLVGQTSDMLVTNLGKSPALLGVVVLNIAALVAAVYFLNLLISGQQQHLQHLLDVQQKQQTEIVQLHKSEFDALLDMNSKLEIAQSVAQQSPIAPTSQTLIQPPAPPSRSR